VYSHQHLVDTVKYQLEGYSSTPVYDIRWSSLFIITYWQHLRSH